MTTYGKDNLIGADRAAATLQLSDPRVVNVVLIVAIIASFVGYLALNNQTSAKNFLIRSMDKHISELEQKRQQLDLQVVAGQSMDTLDGKIQGLGFVPVTGIDYVAAPGGFVAVK